jgi:hypothetical protein
MKFSGAASCELTAGKNLFFAFELPPLAVSFAA